MKRYLSLPAAALAVITLAACSSTAGAPASQAPAAMIVTPSPAPVATPVVTPKPIVTPEPTQAPVGYTLTDVTAAAATADCDVIAAELGDSAKIAATNDRAALEASNNELNKCLDGKYEDAPAKVAFKKPFKFGDWTVTINKVNWNAWKAIHKANMFNDKNPKGTTEVMLYGNVKYNGTGREEFDPYQLKAVGASGSEYSMLDDPDCGVMPTPDMNIDGKTLRHGASQNGYLACFVVDNGDIKSLSAFAEPTFSFDDEDIVEFALR